MARVSDALLRLVWGNVRTANHIIPPFFEPLEKRQLLTTVALTPVADANVQGGASQNTNFGNSNQLVVKTDPDVARTREIYIRFDLAPFNASSATSMTSKLKLTPVSVGLDAPTTVYQLELLTGNAWVEGNGGSDNNPIGEITYANRPTSGTLIGTYTGAELASQLQVDVTQAVRTALANNPDKKISFRLKGNTSGFERAINFASREATNASTRPQLIVTTPDAGTVYVNDFQGGAAQGAAATGVAAAWSKTVTETTPTGYRKFLGQFGNETATLSLSNLSSHDLIQVSFDVYVIRSWDGNDTTQGPDRFQLAADGTTLLDTTFRNANSDFVNKPQNYPTINSPARTGAAENNTLGYAYTFQTGGTQQTSSVYRITKTIAHSAGSLNLDFKALGLQGLADESWGIDNVRVSTVAMSVNVADAANQYSFATSGDLYPERNSNGTASIVLHADLSPSEDSQAPSRVLWKVTSADGTTAAGTVSAASGNFASGDSTITLNPGTSDTFVVTTAYDANGNSAIDGADKLIRTVYAHVLDTQTGPAGFTLKNSVKVPVANTYQDQTGTHNFVSIGGLTTGKTYRLRASGKAKIDNINWVKADAEYRIDGNGLLFDTQPDNSYGNFGLDLGVSGELLTPGTEKGFFWGPYSSDNIYWKNYTASASQLDFKFFDSDYSNNPSFNPSDPNTYILVQLYEVAYLPQVTISATDPGAAEAGLGKGTFSISRTGSTAQALTVSYLVESTSTASANDYKPLPGSVTIPAGSASVSFDVTPVDDSQGEGDETLTLTVQSANAYSPGTPSWATVTIQDNDGLPAPTGLAAAGIAPGRIATKWQKLSDSSVVAYRLYRSRTANFTPAGGTFVASISSQNNTYLDSGLSVGKTYYYLVTAVNADGVESGPSNKASAISKDQDTDIDNDGLPDDVDDDSDNDGDPDSTDADDDNDGIPDENDKDDGDSDNDGIPDRNDEDNDNDGNPDPTDEDNDNDGDPDELDPDDDDDGVPDGQVPVDPDDDNDGDPNGTDPDDDNDGDPDGTDPDDDNDGDPDATDPDDGNAPANAPTAKFGHVVAPAPEGSEAAISFSDQTGTGPFTYSYHWYGADAEPLLDVDDASVVVPEVMRVDGPAYFVVGGRITDSSTGLFSEYLTTWRMENVAPTAAITDAPESATSGSSITLGSDVLDPGINDTFGYSWSVTKDGVDYGTEGIGAPYTFTPNTEGVYVVSLVVEDSDGGRSQTTEATIMVGAPGSPLAPSKLTALAVSDSKVLLTWQDNASDEGGYQVRRSTDSSFSTYSTYTLSANSSSYVDNNSLSANTTYYYRVVATGAPNSAPSNTATATTLSTADQPISITPGVGGTGGDTPGGTSPGADGGDPMSMSYSGAVRYADGRVFFSTADIDPAESGIVSGITRTWSSDPVVSRTSGVVGAGWILSQTPTLLQEDPDTIAVVDGGNSVRWFDKIGSSWVARYFSKDGLVQGVGGDFTLTDTTGNVTSFAATAGSIGKVTRHIDAGGNETAYSYSSTDPTLLETIERKRGGSSGTILEQTDLSYDDAGLLSDVVVSRLNSSLLTPAFEVVRKAEYAYDDVGRLASVFIKDENDVEVSHKHYRYDGSGRLQLVLEGAAYARAYATPLGLPENVNTDTLRTYSNLFLTYDSAGRVEKQRVQGVGTYQYRYSSPGYRTGTNQWTFKTIEYLPGTVGDSWSDSDLNDNDQNVVYSNLIGEVLVKSFDPYSTSNVWVTANQYDAQGRLTLTATPSAVGGNIVESNADIVTPILKTDGLIHVNGYYGASSASSGYLEYAGVKRGKGGAVSRQADYVYGAVRPNSQGRLVTSQRVYQGDGGTGAATTTFAYSFSGDQVHQLTTALPTAAASQNGGGGASTTSTFDSFGREIEFTDGVGKVHTTEYDDATAAVTESVVDAGGLQLRTVTVVDGLGRATSVTDARNNATQYAYFDSHAIHEVVVTPPSPTTGGANAVPQRVVRDDYAAGTHVEFTLRRGTSTIASLDQVEYDLEGRVFKSHRYADASVATYNTSTHALTVTAPGYVSSVSYDGRENAIKSVDALGNITRTVFDALGRPVETWGGTDDAGWSPSSPGSNMTRVSLTEYDAGGVGNANVTKATIFPDGIADGSTANKIADRVTTTKYDWRDRAVISTTGASSDSPPLTATTYDNLDRATASRVYDGTSLSFSALDANSPPTSNPALRSYDEVFYDGRGRVYRTRHHNVDQANGNDSGSLSTDMWYDNRGQVIKARKPGGVVTKAAYDGAGRVIKTSMTDGGGDAAPGTSGSWTDAGNLTGDHVLQQTLNFYDANGNVEFVVTKQRDHDTAVAGDLAAETARVSGKAAYYDQANRQVAGIDFGNNGDDLAAFGSGNAYTRPEMVNSDPEAVNGFDRWLRTDQAYDVNGRAAVSTDPRGIKARTYYDALSRVTGVAEAYTGSITTASIDQDPKPGKDTDRKTVYAYDALDQKTQETAVTFNPQSSTNPLQQTTTYTYGVTKSGGGSFVNNNGLLGKITYGIVADDPSEGLPTLTGLASDEVQFVAYDALGELVRKTDRNGSTHSYTYDTLGRQTGDKVTATASFSSPFLSTWASEAQTAYDTLGRGVVFTVLKPGSAGSSVPVNQVKRVYDGLGNLVTEYQAHDGAVNLATSPRVQYTYDNNLGGNYSRLSKITYPDGRAVSYEYGYFGTVTGSAKTTLNALNGAVSRVGAVSDTATPSDTNRLETYDYLGLGTVVDREYKNVKNGTANQALGQSYLASDVVDGGVVDDAGSSDQYDGLDRFGRVTYYNWYNLGDRRLYAYDADGNMLYSKIGAPSIYNKWRSEIYHLQGADAFSAYDQLNRSKGFARGEMLSGNTSVKQESIEASPGVYIDTQYLKNTSQLWDVNATGDFTRTSQTDAEAVNQGQVFQKPLPAAGTSFDFGATITDLARRDAFLTYDAWGQLISQSSASLAFDSGTSYKYTRTFKNDYAYDALGRRIRETETNRNGSIAQVDLYYDASGSVLQETEKTPAVHSTPAVTQYI